MSRFALSFLDGGADGLHPAGSDPWWREAWYFEFYDPRQNLQFQAYQGVFPNAGTGDLTAAFFRGRRFVHQVMKMDYTVATEPLEERLNFGPMKLLMEAPFERWRLLYDSHDVSANIVFEALHPPYSWAESRLFMEAGEDTNQRSQHFDQFGRYTGTVWIGAEEVRIDALGFRDRMWGWGARRQWVSYVVLWAGFEPGLVANLSIQNFADGSRGLCGYIFRDGERSIAQHARVEIEWDCRRWRSVANVHVDLTDRAGRRLQYSGIPMGISDTSHHWKHRRDHMLFSVGRYRCEGQTGHGVMNWAFLNEAARPVVLEASLPAQEQVDKLAGGAR